VNNYPGDKTAFCAQECNKEYAFFDFSYNGKNYSNDLPQEDFMIVDSVEIIFSTRSPGIIEWSVDYDKDE